MRWEQPVVTVIFGILGTLLAAAGILNHVATFVDDLGDIVAPYAFVVIVDWLWGLANKTDARTYFARLPGWRGQLQFPAIVATVIGFVISFWGSDFLPASFVNNVPLLLVGALISALLYGLVLVFGSRSRLDVAAMEPAGR
jgi:purine-cytosine permease-like protein